MNVYDFDVFGADYRYGPSFALVFCPLAWLPYRVGALIWALFNVGVAYTAIVALCRRIFRGSSPRMRDLVLTAVSCPPHIASIRARPICSSFCSSHMRALRFWIAVGGVRPCCWRCRHIKVWPLAGALLLAACWPRKLAWRLPLALRPSPRCRSRQSCRRLCSAITLSGTNISSDRADPPYLSRRVDDLGTDFDAGQRSNIYGHATCGGGCCAGAVRGAKTAIAARSGWSYSSWHLDDMATGVRPRHGEKYVCPDRPADGLGGRSGISRAAGCVAHGPWIRVDGTSSHRGNRRHSCMASHPPSGGCVAVFRLVFAMEFAGMRIATSRSVARKRSSPRTPYLSRNKKLLNSVVFLHSFPERSSKQ